MRESTTYELPSPATVRDALVQLYTISESGRTIVPFAITVVDIEHALSIDAFIKPDPTDGHTRRLVGPKTIAGQTATVVEDCNVLGCFATWLVETSSFQYRITLPPAVVLQNQDGLLPQRILSTFKFTR